MRNQITTSKAPNQPIAPASYVMGYFQQFSNALRLYFNQVDSLWASLLGRVGGRFVEFPHIAASDTTDQYATADDTPTLVLWNNLDTSNGFTLNLDGTVTPEYPGIYKIDYSLQLVNTDNVAHDVYVWLEVNGGTQVPRSASKFTVPASLVAYSTITFEVAAGDTIALYWATEKAYNSTGPVDGVYMEYIPAQTIPYEHPEKPSAIGSITFVSNTLE